MTVRETIQINLSAMTSMQKWVAGAIAVIAIVWMISWPIGWIKTHFELTAVRAEKNQAEKELKQVKKVLVQVRGAIKKKEIDLEKTEEKRDGKAKEVEDAEDQVSRDRARYDDARNTPVDRIPSTDELCAEFDALGYPCR